MRFKSVLGFAVAFTFLGFHQASAGLVLTLTSTTPDLSMIRVGDTVQFDVTLSGLDVDQGDFLDDLSATVSYEPGLLGAATSLTFGPIVPDLTGTAVGMLAGDTDGFYSSAFADTGSPITSNGLFFSFSVVAQTEGSGEAYFQLTSATLNGLSTQPLAESRVPFTILADLIGVPEPSTLLLGTMGIGVAWCFRRRR